MTLSSTPLNRREFIAKTTLATAAMSSLSVNLAGAAQPAASASSASAPRGERIDCQSHLFCPDAITWMEKRKIDPRVYTENGIRYLKMDDWLRKVPPHYLDVDVKLKTMDAAGISLTALSINDPGPEWFGEDGPEFAQILNNFVADTVRKHPTRFFGICVLPLQNMDAALKELERCVDQLGFKGILLYTNLNGKFADEPEFRPLFAKAVELDVPVLLHPAKPITTEIVKKYEMTSTLGNMFDNTIALTRILMSGLLDEFPKLKLVCPHLGGTLPYIVGRLDHQVTVLKRGPQTLKRKPSEYLRDQVWYDVVSPLPEAVKFIHEFAGPDRLLFSSDHPWVEPDVIADTVLAAGLTPEAQQKIFSLNARKLFRL
jgi:predicted TIM-barrel fold metal-dependent hydrolase